MSVQNTLKERETTHGNFSINARLSQALKRILLYANPSPKLSDSQLEALDLICTKIGRIFSGNPNEPEHWHDIAGYATLVENELRRANEINKM